MARSLGRGAELWATVVAEAKKGAILRVAVAAKHGVSDAALKYHLYKTTGSTAIKSKALALLPVRFELPRISKTQLEALLSCLEGGQVTWKKSFRHEFGVPEDVYAGMLDKGLNEVPSHLQTLVDAAVSAMQRLVGEAQTTTSSP